MKNAIVPYLQRAPRHQGNSAGRRYAVHWFSKGLAGYNPRSANLSDVQANDAVYHYPPPEVMAKSALQSQEIILALFHRSFRRERTRRAGILLSRFQKGLF